jgi:UDP-2,3-diacylglucosamine pyrophosphatase LpxH
MKPNIERNPQAPISRSPAPKEPSMREWFGRFKERQEQVGQPSNDVALTFLVPSIINLMSDLHIGHPTTHYKRIEDEVNTVSGTPNSYVILVGDLIDNMNWNPGQMDQMEQTPEQIGFMWSIIKHLARGQKLLHNIMGDHDESWLMKQGYSMSRELRDLGVSYSTGPTFVHIDVRDGKRYDQHYELGIAHQLPGHSIYNTTHPQARSLRFGSFHGVDVVASGHNHKKGVARAFTHELGKPKPVDMIALGPYKPQDSWLLKKGWPAQQPAEMYGTAVYFDGKTHDIVVDMDILRMNKRMRGR